MGSTTLDSWKPFFYDPNDLIRDEHSLPIKAQNIEALTIDIQRYQTLVEAALGTHIVSNPQKMNLENLEIAIADSPNFYSKKDISNLFINDYYKYPSLQQLSSDDLKEIREINPKDVFNEIMGQIADPGGIVVLIGEVGEGKTALLAKFSLDLKYEDSAQQYCPVILNILRYNDIIESSDDEQLPAKFWERVCEDIIHTLGSVTRMPIPDTKAFEKGEQKSSKLNLKTSLSAFFVNLTLGIEEGSTTKYTESSSRRISLFDRLSNAAADLKQEYNIRLVLIFDNLDTFCYDHERFMLFTDGFDKLKLKVDTVRNIVWGVTNRLINTEISFIFTARPYVYDHVFQSEIHEIVEERVSAVYKIVPPIEPGLSIDRRLTMLNDLANKLKSCTKLSPGKQAAITEHLDDFINRLNKIRKIEKTKPFDKFLHLANQGHRTLVTFYKGLNYDRKLFERYFTHDILYLYLLSKRELYGQLYPPNYRIKQKSHFPNIFLISCDNPHNEAYSEACRPHRLTYWLKYLILSLVHTKDHMLISNILNVLRDYENHAIRLCIGSLSTVNESNCLSLRFPDHLESLTQVEDSTLVSLTRRGQYFLKDNYCMGLDCLQLFIDDWLLPKPKSNILMPKDNSEIVELLEPNLNHGKYSYAYLLNADVGEYRRGKEWLLPLKAKQSLFLLAILKSAQKYEMKLYESSWRRLIEIAGKTDATFLLKDVDNYKALQDRIVDESYRSMRKSGPQLKERLRSFIKFLDTNEVRFDKFFNDIEANTSS